MRDILKDENGSIYFEGAGVIELQLKKRGISMYSMFGDFFPVCCLMLVVFFISLFALRLSNSSKV